MLREQTGLGLQLRQVISVFVLLVSSHKFTGVLLAKLMITIAESDAQWKWDCIFQFTPCAPYIESRALSEFVHRVRIQDYPGEISRKI